MERGHIWERGSRWGSQKIPLFSIENGRLQCSQHLQIVNILSQLKPIQIFKTPFLKTQFRITNTYEHVVSPDDIFLLDYR